MDGNKIELSTFVNYLNLWAKFEPYIINILDQVIATLNTTKSSRSTKWNIGDEERTGDDCKVNNLFCGKYIGLNPIVVPSFWKKYEYEEHYESYFFAVAIHESQAFTEKKPMQFQGYCYYKLDIKDITDQKLVDNIIQIIIENYKKCPK